jgi:hypothetical protein
MTQLLVDHESCYLGNILVVGYPKRNVPDGFQ